MQPWPGDVDHTGCDQQVDVEVLQFPRQFPQAGAMELLSGRSDLSWEDSVRLDMFYVENWSIMADIVIALKTARVVFSHDGSY